MILLDTSFIFALKAEKDKNHKRANELLDLLFDKYNEMKMTPYMVLNETITLAVARYDGKMAHLEKYFNLFWGDECFFKLISFVVNEYQKIYHILEQFCTKKRQISYTDASLIYLFKKYKASLLVSFDSHFDNIIARMF